MNVLNSYERWTIAGSTRHQVHCRTGSLENSLISRRNTCKVHCCIGRLEKYITSSQFSVFISLTVLILKAVFIFFNAAKNHTGVLWLTLVLLLLLSALFFLREDDARTTFKTSVNAHSSYTLNTMPCGFNLLDAESENENESEVVLCAQLQLPKKEGGFILPVTIIRPVEGGLNKNFERSSASKIPLLYFNGGPGAGVDINADNIHDWLGWYRQSGLKRDLILFDRRAVGASKPKLQCLQYDIFSRAILIDDLTVADELKSGRAVIEGCFEKLLKKGFLVELLGTEKSSVDAFELMRALGHQQWHLLGVSYGSRLALVHAAQYPKFVGALILDSVYPPGRGIVSEWPSILEGALKNYFSYCDIRADCFELISDYGDSTESVFWRAVKILRQYPVKLQLDDWWRVGNVDILVNDQRFVAAVFSALYDRNTTLKIAPAIAAVMLKHQRELSLLMAPFVNYSLDDSFNSWVYFSLECRENTAVSTADFGGAVSVNPRLKNYTEGIYRWDICRYLRAQQLLPKQKVLTLDTTFIKNKTVLMLSGELDPITPKRWAQSLKNKFSGANLWLLPNTGHAVVANNNCVLAQLEVYLSAVERGKRWRQPNCD